jgi:signal transduction histidine kinase
MKSGGFKTLVPRSLAARLIILLLLALVVSQAVSVVIFLDERQTAVRLGHQQQLLGRTAAVVRLLRDTPPELHGRIVRTASAPRLQFWLADRSAVDAREVTRRGRVLAARLAELLGESAVTVLVRVSHESEGWLRAPRGWHDKMGTDEIERDDDDRRGDDRRRRRRDALWLTISVLTPGGGWLNAATDLPPAPTPWAWPSLVSMAVMAAAIALIVVVMVRHITRPLKRLAEAADRLGRGEQLDAIPEDGPEEVRRSTRAFNRMSERLARFVQDRTRMLASISHDLRTPITTLRLRAEFVDDRETREKLLQTLEEMQRMTEATLALAQDQAAQEETRSVDLAALLGSLCDDLSDLGHDVGFAEAERLPYPCRPTSLKRAIRNLIENAVAYGTRARVRLEQGTQEPGTQEIAIIIEDDGPGIPEADRERVFEPFVRLEESRSRETGGVGLGMAIARSVVRGHGGDITLHNRVGGGLSTVVHLPTA